MYKTKTRVFSFISLKKIDYIDFLANCNTKGIHFAFGFSITDFHSNIIINKEEVRDFSKWRKRDQNQYKNKVCTPISLNWFALLFEYPKKNRWCRESTETCPWDLLSFSSNESLLASSLKRAGLKSLITNGASRRS